jgi:hypothetical protein
LRPEIERQKYRGPGVLTREVIVRAVVRIDIPDEPTEKAGHMLWPGHVSGIKNIH